MHIHTYFTSINKISDYIYIHALCAKKHLNMEKRECGLV